VTVRTHGTRALSNRDLQDLVTRLNLESQYGRLSQTQVSAGRKLVNGVLKDVAKQEATAFATKFAAKGATWLAKKMVKK
jgi:hypothetical protein